MNHEHTFPRKPPPAPWQAGEKIPWHEPGFSRRMLEQHLSQEHDWASRRGVLIDQHVSWIFRQFAGKRARILDLGCGPGLYMQRLALLGHECVGVDYSPASIAYAREQAAAADLAICYELADVRDYQTQGCFDLVMMVFGEFNVFREAEARALLAKAAGCLAPAGLMLVEASTYEAIHEDGLCAESWNHAERSLFSEAPHSCLEEHFWSEAEATATTRYTIVDKASGVRHEYGSSTKAYSTAQYQQLFANVGLQGFTMLAPEDWPVGEPFEGKMQVMVGHARA